MEKLILVIDDDSALRNSMKDYFEMEDVLNVMAFSAEDGLAKLESRKDEIAGVVCDGLNGEWQKVYEKMQETEIGNRGFMLYSSSSDAVDEAQGKNIKAVLKASNNDMGRVIAWAQGEIQRRK